MIYFVFRKIVCSFRLQQVKLPFLLFKLEAFLNNVNNLFPPDPNLLNVKKKEKKNFMYKIKCYSLKARRM